MADVEQYTYKIFWSDEDQEWVGVCAEFGAPLSWLDPDKQAAERGIRTLVRESIEILEEHGESIPEPAVLAARQPAAVARAEVHPLAPPTGAAPTPTFRSGFGFLAAPAPTSRPGLELPAAPGRLAGPVMCGQRLRSGAACQRQLLTKPCPKHPSSAGSNQIRRRSTTM